MANETSARLMKWPSLSDQRISGATPYTLRYGDLQVCTDFLRKKPISTHHLYEIYFDDDAVLSAAEALALVANNNDTPPAAETDRHTDWSADP